MIQMTLPNLMGFLLLPLAALVFVGLVIWGLLRMSDRHRVRLNEERLAAMERGIPLPPDVFLTNGRRHPRNSLRTGMVELALGVGLVAALLICCPESRLWGWGIVVILVGVANLVYWGLRGREEWDEARARDRELVEKWSAGGGARDREAGDS